MAVTRVTVHHPRAAQVELRSGQTPGGWEESVAPIRSFGEVSEFALELTDEPLELKPVLREEWALGPNSRVAPGARVELFPTFSRGAGEVKTLFHDFYSPTLGNTRDIYAYVPPGYAENGHRRYPVLYLHDGQAVFESAGNGVDSWHLERTLDDLIGRDVIPPWVVVAVPHQGPERMAEYTPVADPRHGGGRGDAYLDFLFEELKPEVDRALRTATGPKNTALMGSSLGGHLSLYAGHTRASEVGRVAALSPTTSSWNGDWLSHQVETGQQSANGLSKLWVDHGNLGPHDDDDPSRLIQAYRRHGLQEGGGRFQSWIEPGARHDNASWGRRAFRALGFALG